MRLVQMTAQGTAKIPVRERALTPAKEPAKTVATRPARQAVQMTVPMAARQAARVRARADATAVPAAAPVAAMRLVRMTAPGNASKNAIRTVRPIARTAVEDLLASRTANRLVQTAAKQTAIRIVEHNAQITATEAVVGVPEAVLADAHHALDSCGNKKGTTK